MAGHRRPDLPGRQAPGLRRRRGGRPRPLREDALGLSVAVSASTVVVGAAGDDDNGDASGSTYVFTEPGGGWAGILNEAAKLLASDGAAEDFFGASVAVSGSTVVVGAGGDDANGAESGSAYVFTEPGGGWAGTLNEAANLLACDGAAADFFGTVAVSGSTVVVGASEDDDKGAESGSAYVFTEPGGGWAGTLTEAAKLLASDGAAGDFFATSVAVSDATVVVGTGFFGDEPVFGDTVYVFTEPGGGWAGTLNEAAKLGASDGAADDYFGTSVAVSGGTVVVGAHQDDDSGSAYVFTEPGGGWSGTLDEAAKLLASDGGVADFFGTAVSVSESTVVVGAPIDDLVGSAYLFIEPAGGWAGIVNETNKCLASDGAELDLFGGSVAVSGSSVVVGAPRPPGSSETGSAYVCIERGPVLIFTDGFESGDTTAWSTTVP